MGHGSFDDSGKTIFTIGHSTRTLEELIVVLEHYRIRTVVDIRHFPTSRHNPQFNKSALEEALAGRGIEYVWLERLGGYRNGGYLAHMESPDFCSGLEDLENLARRKPTACLCAEVKWYRCHRRHVSDVLAARGWRVIHIIDQKRSDAHCQKTNRIKCD